MHVFCQIYGSVVLSYFCKARLVSFFKKPDLSFLGSVKFRETVTPFKGRVTSRLIINLNEESYSLEFCLES